MTFDKWMAGKVPAYHKTDDNKVLRLLREAWQTGFCDGYEKGMTAFHEAVAMEREACAKICERHAETQIDNGALTDSATDIRMRSNVEMRGASRPHGEASISIDGLAGSR